MVVQVDQVQFGKEQVVEVLDIMEEVVELAEVQQTVVAEEVLISRKPSQALVDGVALQAVAPAAILLLERQVLRLRVIQAAQL